LIEHRVLLKLVALLVCSVELQLILMAISAPE